MKRWHLAFAALALGVPLWVYVRTLTASIPFWDSGEFIATSYILGLPHPPGSPVVTMIGRLLCLIPFQTVAWRINFLSALASSLTALFTFLVTTRALRRWFAQGVPSTAAWIACEVGGVVAAYFIAFSSSFWDSAIEAEVYSLASLMIIFVVWLAFNWWDHIGERLNDAKLVLIAYLISFAIGIHLGTVLVGFGLIVLFALVRPGYFTSKFWLSFAGIWIFVIAFVVDMFYAGVDVPGPIYWIWLAVLLGTYVMYSKRLVKNNLATWWMIAIIVGFTVQLFLLFRSQQHPMINEGAPQTLDMWKDYLLRKQYGPANPFVRRAPLLYQINHMFLRYVGQQFQLVERLGPFGPSSGWVIAINVIPYLFLALGAYWNYKRDKKTFWFFAVQHFVMGPMLLFYLNFTDHEVRERDYFFTNEYHFIAIWMGMGAAGLLEQLIRSLVPSAATAPAPARGAPAAAAVAAAPPPMEPLPAGGTPRGALALGAVTLIGISLLPVKAGWYEHDRSDFYIAHDYAYNMLVPLEKNAIIFTNGDNDTFPLWCIQEVEHVRKDVRVVNLSLLNTPWYIRQLRDQEPKVPFSYTDREVDALEPYYDDKQQKVIWVKDMAAANLIATNDWKKPVYLAVTVPEQLGLEKRLSLEGLVYRVEDHEVGPHTVDVNRTIHNLYSVFRYQGLLDKNRNYDSTVYKDDNAQRLVQNYTAAHVQVAYRLEQEGHLAEAVNLMRDATKISPEFPGIFEYLGRLYEETGDFNSAEAAYREGMQREPGAAEYGFLLGSLLYNRGRQEGRPDAKQEGIQLLRRAVELNQQYFDWFGALFLALWQEGSRQEALEVLRTWLRSHPDDAPRAAILQHYEDSLRTGEAPGTRGAPGARTLRRSRG